MNSRLMSVLLVLAMTMAPAVIAVAAESDEIWEMTYGDTEKDFGYDMEVTDDGGFIMVGTSYSGNLGGKDILLVKTDADGNTEWTRFLGGAANDNGKSVEQSADGGYVIGGYTDIGSGTTHQGLVIKTDSEGNVQWQTSIGGDDRDLFEDVKQCRDQGYILVGDTESFGPNGSSFYIVKVDSLGGIVWERHEGSGDDHLYAVIETDEGDFVACGYSGDGHTFPTFDARLLKFSSEGDLLWQRSFDLSDYDRAYNLCKLSGGDIAMTGEFAYSMGVFRLNDSGVQVWYRSYSTITSDYGLSVTETSDGGVLVGGSTYNYDDGEYQMYIAKSTGDGTALWTRLYGGAYSESCSALRETVAGDYAFFGSTNSQGAGSFDFLLITAEGPDATDIGGGDTMAARARVAAHPNPFNPSTRIAFHLPRAGVVRLEILDASGRRVRVLQDGYLDEGSHDIDWDGRDDAGRPVSGGVYFANLAAAKASQSFKLTLLK